MQFIGVLLKVLKRILFLKIRGRTTTVNVSLFDEIFVFFSGNRTRKHTL